MRMRDLKKSSVGAVSMKVIIIVVLVVIMVSASTLVVMFGSGSKSNPNANVVENGDTVTVNYIGSLTDGRIFDTNIWSVANDSSEPKSLTFTLKSQSSYTPLTFTVGSGKMIPGFNDAVIGMTLSNPYKNVTIPPSQAYPEQAKYNKVFNLTQESQVIYEYNYSQFTAKYSITTPVQGMWVADPFYGWPAQITIADSNADRVQVSNAPQIDGQYRIYAPSNTSLAGGWYVRVVSVDSSANGGLGRIIVHSQLTAADDRNIMGYDKVSSTSTKTFIVTNVSVANDTCVLAYNDSSAGYNAEIAGQTLEFEIILLSITKK
jgi:FKBP-type peptidyl-prolyl cis-trans isomerase 2